MDEQPQRFIPYEKALALMEAMQIACASTVDKDGRSLPVEMPKDIFGHLQDMFPYYVAVGKLLSEWARQPVQCMAPGRPPLPPLYKDADGKPVFG